MIRLIKTKILSIAGRHGAGLFLSLAYEVFIRLYSHSWFRAFVRIFFRYKEPSSIGFVLGCYNSGTTIIKDCMALHPYLAKAPVEGSSISNALPDFDGSEWPRCLFGNLYNVEHYRKFGVVDKRRYLSDMRPWVRSGRPFLEKGISCSVIVSQLEAAFDRPKYIVVIRHPLAVAKGIVKKSAPGLVARNILRNDRYPNALLMRQWKYFYDVIADEFVDASRFHLVVFEEFLKSPVETISGVFEFLNLPDVAIGFSDNCLVINGRSIKLVSPRPVKADSDCDADRMYQEMLDRMRTALRVSVN